MSKPEVEHWEISCLDFVACIRYMEEEGLINEEEYNALIEAADEINAKDVLIDASLFYLNGKKFEDIDKIVFDKFMKEFPVKAEYFRIRY